MVPVRPVEDPDDALGALLRGLAASARAANLARTAVIEDALAASAAGTLDEGRREAAESAAHQVVGSAGTFGRHRASELAAALEQWFRAGPPPDDVGGLERALVQVAELRAALAGAHQDEL